MLLLYRVPLFSAHILPPCASMILLDIYRPRPVPPLSDFEANLANSLGNTSESIPIPVSLTDTITTSSTSFFSAEKTILSSTSVNLIALLRRLDSTLRYPSFISFYYYHAVTGVEFYFLMTLLRFN